MTILRRATYTNMATSTPEDWEISKQHMPRLRERLPDHVLSTLKQLQHREDGGPITGFDHSLQAATLAFQDGADDENVFIALLHDIGQVVSLENHSEVAAGIIRPYVSERSYWIVKHHEIFQGYYFWQHFGKDRNARDAYRDNPYFEACAEWCDKYDQRAFDPRYPTKPLVFFEPVVWRIFARKPWSALKPVGRSAQPQPPPGA